MDLVEQLAKQASQISMYDIKSYYNQAKNAVLNVSEMEAKVREATNDDSWGASSTLMQEIAQGTHNFQQFNEILPLIWSRFHECEARDWRQIYKALTLLEYLVKNGSERVVDDARSHVSTIKMLRSFHYTDEKGKDQGINVRNRAKELADLLGDIERIRQERRKSKQNRNKYSGISGGGGGSMSGGGGGGGGRYGGFGSDSYNYNSGSGSRGYSGRDDYDSGDLYRGSGTANRGGSGSSSRGGDFDQYDAGDDEDVSSSARPATTAARTSSAARASKGKTSSAASSSPAPAAPPAAAPKPIVDLFDFDDEVPAPSAPAMPAAAPAPDLVDDDDFTDFQAAPTSSGFTSAPVAPAKPASAGGNVFDFLDAVPPPSTKPTAPAFSPISPSQPAFNFGGFGGMGGTSASRPGMVGTVASKPAVTTTSSSGGGLGGFDDLWNTSLSSAGGSKPAASGKKTIAEMEREKTMASLWGAPANNASSPAQQKPSSGGFEDLLG